MVTAGSTVWKSPKLLSMSPRPDFRRVISSFRTLLEWLFHLRRVQKQTYMLVEGLCIVPAHRQSLRIRHIFIDQPVIMILARNYLRVEQRPEFRKLVLEYYISDRDAFPAIMEIVSALKRKAHFIRV